jgi:AcrR family transcriptional regulator
MCIIHKRANNPEQKALRKQQILDATRKRFTSLSYEEVNLNHIAADLGITKAALYRYFRNKETLFLALFVESLNELILSAEKEITQAPLAQAITNTLTSNPIYCKLSAILHTILERNLTAEEALQFKKTLLHLTSRYAQLLSQHPSLAESPDQAIALLMHIQQAVIGVWHMTHPTGAIAEVIKTPPLDVFRQGFNEALLSHISKIIPNH